MTALKPTVIFHVLDTDSPQSAWRFVAESLNTQYLKQAKTLLLTETNDDAVEWDDFLWSYSTTSFLPHVRFDKHHPTPEYLQIGHDTSLLYPFPSLFNMTDCVPIYTEHFHHIHEFVYQNTRVQEANRAKYRRYQTLKYAIETQKITLTI